MLREGRTLRELLAVAARVYSPPPRIYERQDGMIAVLGALKGRPWGDSARAEEIRSAAREVLG